MFTLNRFEGARFGDSALEPWHAVLTRFCLKLHFIQRYLKLRSRREDDRALNYILQLPNISWPMIALERRNCRSRKGLDSLLQPTCEFACEEPNQEGAAFLALAERRYCDRKPISTGIKGMS